jgi:prepilin-type N-terminal cleavage/methylation domain-containing protein
MKRLQGFTLIELMIAVAILAIVSAIAIPAYNNYILESRLGAMRMNLDSLRIAVEAFRLDSTAGNFGNTTYSGVAAISNQYAWRPEGDQGGYLYFVSATSATPPTYCLRAESNNAYWIQCTRGRTPFCIDCVRGRTPACSDGTNTLPPPCP